MESQIGSGEEKKRRMSAFPFCKSTSLEQDKISIQTYIWERERREFKLRARSTHNNKRQKHANTWYPWHMQSSRSWKCFTLYPNPSNEENGTRRKREKKWKRTAIGVPPAGVLAGERSRSVNSLITAPTWERGKQKSKGQKERKP